ncbi:uncharacterized protein C8R40DRAFT_1264575 [Lentinula edodes]|uniref:uncharacterized protein n=1 Tax=Lentinula edodes TaxID=5353 RepID=UPI001E8EDB81|nr:uncharacterized protein C8R40DRAFT_1264575 [Lentinula edodes]KAH7876327.1 hypothetical protein C8R40DRAFT_1264575 [Lentinula edodes]
MTLPFTAVEPDGTYSRPARCHSRSFHIPMQDLRSVSPFTSPFDTMPRLARAFDSALETVTGSPVFLRKLCRFGFVGGIHEVIWAQLRSFNSAIAKYYQDYVLDGVAVALIDHREEDGRRRCLMQRQEWVVQGEVKQPKSAKRVENDMGWRIGLSDDGSEYEWILERKWMMMKMKMTKQRIRVNPDSGEDNERGGDDLELGPDLSDILLERAGGNGNGPKVATSGDTARGGGDSGRENMDSEDAIER